MRAAVWTGRREGVDLAPRNTLAVRIHLQHKKNKNKNEITDLFSNKKRWEKNSFDLLCHDDCGSGFCGHDFYNALAVALSFKLDFA